ncbi:MAG: hypothetical protein H0W88_11190 [Parachlamydiaceae bacterium]|nr:hypothetical protein [Parachlamydiaceae bacterium]
MTVSSSMSIGSYIQTTIQRVQDNDPTLTELPDDFIRLDNEDQKAFFQALKVNRFIKELRIIGWTFQDNCLALANYLKVSRSITKLEMQHNNYKDHTELDYAAHRVLCEGLKENRSLVSLSITHSLDIDAFKILCKWLNANKNLIELCVNVDRYNKEDHVLALAKGLKENKTLIKLGIHHSPSKISPKTCTILVKAIMGIPSLEEVNLRWFNIGTEACGIFAEALKANCPLKILNLEHNYLTAQDGIALAESLKTNKVLQKLDVSQNSRFDETTGKAFAKMLFVNRTLKKLNLEHDFDIMDKRHGIGPDNGIFISESLETNNSLTELNLSCNEFNLAVFKAIGKMLTINSTLLILHLRKTNMDNEGAEEIARRLVTNKTLKEIDLSNNKISGKGGIAVADSLFENSTLEKVSLCSSDLDHEAAIAFAEVIGERGTLKELNLMGNEIGTEAEVEIADALAKNSSLEILGLGFSGQAKYTDGVTRDKTAIALGKALEGNCTLTSLDLKEGSFTIHGLNAFNEALKVNCTLQKLVLFKKKHYSSDKEAIDMDSDVGKSILKRLKFNKFHSDKQKKESSKKEERKGVEKAPSVQSAQQQVAAARYFEKVERKDDGSNESKGDGKGERRLSLDEDDIEKIKALPDAAGVRSAMSTAKALENIDLKALETLTGHAQHLQELFESSAKAHHNDSEIAYISDNLILDTYYRYFSRQLTGVWLACLTINTGWVKNAEQYNSDYIAAGLKKIGDHIPGISIATSIIDGVVETWNDREKRIGVQRIALLFPDLETAFKELSTLVRQLTLSQKEALKKLPAKPKRLGAKIKEGLKDIKAAILADDIDDPAKRKAVDDCSILLTAIKEGKYNPKQAVASLLTVIMGTGFVYSSPVSITESTATSGESTQMIAVSADIVRSSVGAGGQSLGMGDMHTRMQQMEERVKLAEKSARDADDRARRAEELAKKNGGSVEVPGGHSAMALASPHSKDSSQSFEEIHKRLATTEKQVGTLTQAAQEHQDRVKRLEEPKKATKGTAPKKEETCSIM